jgi:hypothetical protein
MNAVIEQVAEQSTQVASIEAYQQAVEAVTELSNLELSLVGGGLGAVSFM